MLALLVALGALALRAEFALRPGISLDEVFSLAMATGHSLEHPAVDARPTLGDFAQAPVAEPASAWQRYLSHESPPAGPGRVVRAVFYSDTNPPLYYLLLSAWTRFAGTGDAALTLFSVLAALACFPVLWSLGRFVGSRSAAVVACFVFAFAPTAIFYSVVGRMYSLTWLLAVSLAWLSVRLHRRGGSVGRALPWVLCGAGALLTHYFLAFVWLACLAWLLLVPGRIHRGVPLVLGAASFALAAPWYLRIPDSLARWRVTAGWLEHPLGTGELLQAPFTLVWSMLAPSVTGGDPTVAVLLVALPLAAALITLLGRGIPRTDLPRWLLPALWLGAAVLGLVAFDVWRGTYTSLISRYAMAGLPAAALLVGLAFSRLPRRVGAVLLLVVAAGWTIGGRPMFAGAERPWQPFRAAAAHLDANTGPGDLIVIRSIPSGILGITRYMEGNTPVAAWVEQLGTDAAPYLGTVTRGFCRVVLVSYHVSTEVNTAEPWLRAHARLVGEVNHWGMQFLYFQQDPQDGRASPNCAMMPILPGG